MMSELFRCSQLRAALRCAFAVLVCGVIACAAGGMEPPRGEDDCEPRWVRTFGAEATSGPNSTVLSLAHFDDGSGDGPALYAGGSFTAIDGEEMNHIARWDGVSWCNVGRGLDGSVYAIIEYNGELYAGGWFITSGDTVLNNIARWDAKAEEWKPLGPGLSGGAVQAMAAFDDGSGPKLYVGGTFTATGDGTLLLKRLARWDDALEQWQPVGGGVDVSNSPWPWVYAMTVFDDGTGDGEALYVGGRFVMAGDIVVNNIAKWNGSEWSTLDDGVSGGENIVTSLAGFDDGSGPALFVGGVFNNAGSVEVVGCARWTGEWARADLGGTQHRGVFALHASGPVLDAALASYGTATAGVPTTIARWDADSAQFVQLGTKWFRGTVYALTHVPDGNSAEGSLYAGGFFTCPQLFN